MNESIKATDTTPVTEEVTEPEPTTLTETTVTETENIETAKPQIPPRPVMPPKAAAYSKLRKIKTVLDKQNNLIFETERERNTLEFERDDLKGFAKLTKKKELDSRIASKNEEIKVLKARLSGIVRQHGFETVQDFYTAFYTAQCAANAYQNECTNWDETYGEKTTPKAKTMHEKLQRYKETADKQNISQPFQNRDKGAR